MQAPRLYIARWFVLKKMEIQTIDKGALNINLNN
jgi:hypothetical protein